jgi:hypothetical protein
MPGVKPAHDFDISGERTASSGLSITRIRIASKKKVPLKQQASKQTHRLITYDSKQHNLGSFNTKQEAALAYDREARQCGEDKPLNYESIEAAEEAAAAAASPA